MSTRRSAREIKRTEFYLGSNDTAGKSSLSDVEEENKQSNKVSSDSEDHLPKRKKRPPASTKEDKAPLDTAEVPSNGNRGSLFAKVSTSSKYDEDVRSWINSYKSDRHAAMASLVNFILISAGGKREWIEPDVDLEPLETDEIQVLLSDMIDTMASTAGTKVYPLIEKGKNRGLSYRERYQKFFESLVENLRYLPVDSNKRALQGSEILRRVIGQLIPFSSLSVSNVRDAISEACLSIASALVKVCLELKNLKSTEDKQISAEKSKDSGVDAKHTAHIKQRDELVKELETYSSMINMIFNAIYIHRSKDSHDEIRLTCVRHIYSLVLFEPTKPLKAEYLKYLGWACYDYAHSVRVEAIESIKKLVENGELISHLMNFVDSFMKRFIEIASADIDGNVSLAMIESLLLMQEKGYLDSVPAEQLDLVDQVVFDSTADVRVRQEALKFMMAHTEGFDEFDEEKHIESLTQGNKKKTDTIKQQLLIAKKKNTALQLETLTEFAEYHLGGNVEWSGLLAEACLGTDKAHLLYEWSTLIALLTREGESWTTHPLRPSQVSILLRMLAFTAKAVYKQKQDLERQQGNRKAQVTQLVNDRYESLTNTLQSELPTLLSRFQDNKENLTILSELFICCDMITNKKVAKNMMGKMSDLFRSFVGETLLSNICKAFGYFIHNHQNIASVAKEELRGLLSEGWTQITQHLNSLNSQTTASTKKKKSTGTSNVDESMFELTSALEKFRTLWQSFDCRQYLDVEMDTMISDLIELVDLIPSILTKSISTGIEEQCVLATRHCFMILLVYLLWMHTDILTLGRENLQENEEKVKENVQALVNVREKIVDAAMTLIEMEEEGESNTIRKLQLQGYHAISEVMTFFPARYNSHIGMEGLAFVANQRILNGLRKVFEGEGLRVQRELAVLEEENNTETAAVLANHLIEEILVPLSQSMIFDVPNVNRRQAAAVLYYLLVPNEEIQSAIKAIARKLKEGDMIKYLEIQLVALRGIYMEHVQKQIRLRKQAEENEDESFDFIASERAEGEGYEKLGSLAKKFASFFGVKKLKEEMLNTLNNFFREGVNFALSDVTSVGFVEALVPYLRFFTTNRRSTVLQMLHRALENQPAVERELDMQRPAPSQEFGKLIGFIDALEGKGQNRAERRMSKQSPLDSSGRASVSITGEDEEEAFTQPKASHKKKTAAKSAKSVGSSAGKKRKQVPVSPPPAPTGARKSYRNVKKVGSYREDAEDISEAEDDEGEDEEDEEEEVGAGRMEPPKRPRSSAGQQSRRTTSTSLALGLNLEDIEEEEEEGEQEGRQLFPPIPSQNSRGMKRSYDSLQFNPVNSASTLDHIPSRRRAYQQL